MTPSKTIRWRSLNTQGMEHLILRQSEKSVAVESLVIGEIEGATFGLSYKLSLDRSWRLQEAHLRLAGQDNALILRCDGAGHWQDGANNALSQFAGCIDIDIAVTPFTNTLPIQRLALPIDGSKEIRVVYVPIPSLQPRVMSQRYTRKTVDRYLYEGLSSNFKAELTVDNDGLVIDYPSLFERVM